MVKEVKKGTELKRVEKSEKPGWGLREWQRGSFELELRKRGLGRGTERDTVKCWKTSQLMVFDFHSNYHSSGSVHSQSGPILYPHHIPQMISWPTTSPCCPRPESARTTGKLCFEWQSRITFVSAVISLSLTWAWVNMNTMQMNHWTHTAFDIHISLNVT